MKGLVISYDLVVGLILGNRKFNMVGECGTVQKKMTREEFPGH